MPYITVQSQRVYYSEHRDDLANQRIPLVLVHGAGGVSFNWPPGLRRLPNHDVYAIDLPGHGRSAGPGRKTIGDYSEFVMGWARAMDLSAFVLAGHSMGGAVAMLCALRYPQRFRGLVLVATAARLHVHPDILQGVSTDRESTGQTLVDWVHGRRATPNQRRQYLRHFLAQDADVLRGDWEACDQFDIRDRVSGIDTPTLIIAGSQDQMTPVKSTHHLAERMADADYTIVEGAGHMVMLEQPALVISAVAGFMARLRRI